MLLLPKRGHRSLVVNRAVKLIIATIDGAALAGGLGVAMERAEFSLLDFSHTRQWTERG